MHRLHALARLSRALAPARNGSVLATLHTATVSARVYPPAGLAAAMGRATTGVAGAGASSSSSPPPPPAPLTVTRLFTSTADPPTAADLAATFASLGFTRVKGPLKLEADAVMRSHATPTPRLLGVSAGKFLISVDPHDPADDNGGGGSGGEGAEDAALKTESLQLGPGSYLLMPAGVRHSAWVVGGAAVDLWMAEQDTG